MYVIILQNNGKHCNLSNYIFHTSSLKNVSAILFISLFQPVMNTLPDCRIDRIKSIYLLQEMTFIFPKVVSSLKNR